MFKYDNSNRNSQPGEKPVKHVSQVRSVTYVNYDSRTKRTKTSQGWEIVKEIVLDPQVPISYTADIVGTKVVENIPKEALSRLGREIEDQE